MWVSSCPQTQLHALFIALGSMVGERNIKFLLEPRVGFPVSLREAQQRFVARMMTNRMRERVICGEIDAQRAKSFK